MKRARVITAPPASLTVTVTIRPGRLAPRPASVAVPLVTVAERLNLSWILFFAVVGALNLYVAYRYPTATWVNFKLFGVLGLMLVFVVLQSVLLAPFLETKADETADRK
jgi:hypothetical protein